MSSTSPQIQPSGLRAVLHPTDLGHRSDAAFSHALRIALEARSKLYVLHAERELPESGVDWSAFPSIRGTLARWQLLEAGAEPRAVFDRLGLSVRKVDLVDEDPVRAIVRFEQDHPSDLVVLATHGRTGVDRWVRRSVAEPVARELQVPTLFLPREGRGFVDVETGEVRLQRVLFPVDASPKPERAMRVLKNLLETLKVSGVEVMLLHVGDVADQPVVDLARDVFGGVITRSTTGPVVDRIVEMALEREIDLVVMATRGHEGFLDALRGSTTEQVLRRAARPLLAVPSH